MGDLGQREHSSNYRTSEHNNLMGDLGQREHSSNYSDE